jgi:enoyl-CoA hydratase
MPTLDVQRIEGLAVLRLDKPRGNSIDEAMVQELIAAARELAGASDVRGVLLASAHPKLFCPGLDLVSLSSYGRHDMRRFMLGFGAAVTAWYAFPKPVVAAVSGAAVAGGCILAMTADQRLLRRGAMIGLNEVKIGVPVPWSVAVLLRSTVPPSSIAKVALLGRNFADEEAVTTGLADTVLEAEGFEARCIEVLAEFAEKDARAFGRTKEYLRHDALAEMTAHEEVRIGEFLDCWFSPATQQRIRETIAALGAR